MKFKSILFICAGNTCRSPMAMVIAKQLLPTNIFVDSAGVVAEFNTPANLQAQRTVAFSGLDLTKHKSKPAYAIDLDRYDYIVTLDGSVAKRLEQIYKVDENRLISLEITDPFGNGEVAYLDTFHILSLEITKLLAKLI